jgi:hypothetical protein
MVSRIGVASPTIPSLGIHQIDELIELFGGHDILAHEQTQEAGEAQLQVVILLLEVTEGLILRLVHRALVLEMLLDRLDVLLNIVDVQPIPNVAEK